MLKRKAMPGAGRATVLMLALLGGASTRAQADPIAWEFNFTIQGGVLLGTTVSGKAIFDSNLYTPVCCTDPNIRSHPLTSMVLNIGDARFDLSHAFPGSTPFIIPTGPFQGYGLEYHVDSSILAVTPINGITIRDLGFGAAGATVFGYRGPFSPDVNTGWFATVQTTQVPLSTAAVPEPSSLLALLAGFAIVSARRRTARSTGGSQACLRK